MDELEFIKLKAFTRGCYLSEVFAWNTYGGEQR